MNDAQTRDRLRPEVEKAADPVLKLNFMSHGTLESRDLDKTREFYADFLGLEVIRTSPVSLAVRLGGRHTMAVVQQANKGQMSLLNHNGLDVETESEVDAAYEKVVEYAEKYSISKITKPREQHGTYSFYFWDLDDNAWEILANPKDGYSWVFELGGDLEGKGHMERDFKRPEETRK